MVDHDNDRNDNKLYCISYLNDWIIDDFEKIKANALIA